MSEHARVAVSRRIADDLREAIAAGRYAVGARLPSVRALASEYRCAVNTANRALRILAEDGVTVTRPGVGAVVRARLVVRRMARGRLTRQAREAGRAGFLADAAAQGFAARSRTVVRVREADRAIAGLLEVPVGEPVLERDRVMFADEVPVQLAVSWLPRSITEGTRLEEVDTGPSGSYGLLDGLGRGPVVGQETLFARGADTREARELGVPVGEPVQEVTRVVRDQWGVVVEVCWSVMVGAGVRLVYPVRVD